MSNKPKVGVYVCHCGGNISDVIDVKKLAADLGTDEDVEYATEYVFMCSNAGQNLIIEDIKSKNLDHVVVAACSPALHEGTFRGALERAGLNPYVYEHVNIREQASWVHKEDHEGATKKAHKLIKAGINKVSLQNPLDPLSIETCKDIAVVGGGLAGMTAALALARSGHRIFLLEKEKKLGGNINALAQTFPDNLQGSEIVKKLESEIKANDKIKVFYGAEIENVTGYVGQFNLALKNLENTFNLLAGAIVIATGFNNYPPREGEYNYLKNNNIITLQDFISELSKNNTAKDLVINGKNIKKIAFIHCVGSREIEGIHTPQEDGQINSYCSRICCTSTLHNIEQVMLKFPKIKTFDFYQDIRTYGRWHEQLYDRVSKLGTLFFRYTGETPPTVSLNAESISITVKDVLTWNEEVEVEADLLVLATGMLPGKIDNLMSILKLPKGADRFISEVHPKLRPVEIANNGIYLAGTCKGPGDIVETITSAKAAAVKAAALLSKDNLFLDPFVAVVKEDLCDGCGLCIPECAYTGAIKIVKRTCTSNISENIASVNAALCKGCGACAGVCPKRAIDVAGWSIAQIEAMVDAIVKD